MQRRKVHFQKYWTNNIKCAANKWIWMNEWMTWMQIWMGSQAIKSLHLPQVRWQRADEDEGPLKSTHISVKVSAQAPVCGRDLTSWLMSGDVASTFLHHLLSSWFHLFSEVHQSLLQLNTPTPWCCHPRTSESGWCSQSPSFPVSSKYNNGHYSQTGHVSKN